MPWRTRLSLELCARRKASASSKSSSMRSVSLFIMVLRFGVALASSGGRGASVRLAPRVVVARAHTQTGAVGQDQLTFFYAHTFVGVVIHEQHAVEVGVVYERAEMRGGGDRQRAFDHAAQHDLEVVRPRGVDHA